MIDDCTYTYAEPKIKPKYGLMSISRDVILSWLGRAVVRVLVGAATAGLALVGITLIFAIIIELLGTMNLENTIVALIGIFIAWLIGEPILDNLGY